jgi:hypothetical protein
MGRDCQGGTQTGSPLQFLLPPPRHLLFGWQRYWLEVQENLSTLHPHPLHRRLHLFHIQVRLISMKDGCWYVVRLLSSSPLSVLLSSVVSAVASEVSSSGMSPV